MSEGRFDHWADVRDRSSFKQAKVTETKSQRRARMKKEAEIAAIEAEERALLEFQARQISLETMREQGRAEVDALCNSISEQSVGRGLGMRILKAVAKKHGVSIVDMRNGRRYNHLVLARHEVCYLVHKHVKLSYYQIAGMLGWKDHTSVIHGIKAHAKRNGLD